MTPVELISQHFRTVDEIYAEHAVFTDAQRSLAWSPMPPPGPFFSEDCRFGMGGAIDHDSPRSQWVTARHRMLREMRTK